jgi:UDP-glucose 4-epimerase
MIYGDNSPGNLSKLLRFFKYSPIIPIIQNQRSLIKIDSLLLFIEQIIDNPKSKIFHPRDEVFFSTSDFLIDYFRGYKIMKIHSKIAGYCISILLRRFRIVKKVFGSLIIGDIE